MDSSRVIIDLAVMDEEEFISKHEEYTNIDYMPLLLVYSMDVEDKIIKELNDWKHIMSLYKSPPRQIVDFKEHFELRLLQFRLRLLTILN